MPCDKNLTGPTPSHLVQGVDGVLVVLLWQQPANGPEAGSTGHVVHGLRDGWAKKPAEEHPDTGGFLAQFSWKYSCTCVHKFVFHLQELFLKKKISNPMCRCQTTPAYLLLAFPLCLPGSPALVKLGLMLSAFWKCATEACLGEIWQGSTHQPYGYGSKKKTTRGLGPAGVSPCFHLPGFHFWVPIFDPQPYRRTWLPWPQP